MKYQWRPELDQILKDGYASSHGRKQLSSCIAKVASLSGFPRWEVKDRARTLMLTHNPCRRWTEPEMRYLEGNAGNVRASHIAKTLGRSVKSVNGAMYRLGIRWAVTDGYSQKDLAQLLHVSCETIFKWNKCGWLRRSPEDRYCESSVANFLRNHPETYDLRRVDQEWFKSLMFPQAGCYQVKHSTYADTRDQEEMFA